MEYVHLKDMRAAGFELFYAVGRSSTRNGLYYYESSKDWRPISYGYLPKGTYVFEYDLRVPRRVILKCVTTIQLWYAPEFTSQSAVQSPCCHRLQFVELWIRWWSTITESTINELKSLLTLHGYCRLTCKLRSIHTLDRRYTLRNTLLETRKSYSKTYVPFGKYPIKKLVARSFGLS